jgi:hypothetical protein
MGPGLFPLGPFRPSRRRDDVGEVDATARATLLPPSMIHINWKAR